MEERQCYICGKKFKQAVELVVYDENKNIIGFMCDDCRKKGDPYLQYEKKRKELAQCEKAVLEYEKKRKELLKAEGIVWESSDGMLKVVYDGHIYSIRRWIGIYWIIGFCGTKPEVEEELEKQGLEGTWI